MNGATVKVWRARAGRLFLLAGMLLQAGCATHTLEAARGHFYAGRFNAAEEKLSDENTAGLNRVLVLMERGTIRQAAGKYDTSARDFDKAWSELDQMTDISVSQDTGSMVINDNVQEYRGAHFERTLLHAVDAMNYLAIGKWDDAAVEARRITRLLEPEQRKDYPEDAYSRYVAGFCFEMLGDASAAEFEYKKAKALAKHLAIDEKTGAIHTSSNRTSRYGAAGDTGELVCFVAQGRSPRGADLLNNYRQFDHAPYAEIVSQGRVLGRSYNLADTVDLAFTTEQILAARKAVKTVARIAAKEVIAHQVEQQDELIGALVRIVLIGLLEQPDIRRWETLPRWLQVARVSCPPGLKEFDVVFRDAGGRELGRQHITAPLQRNGRISVSFCRDIAAQPGG